MEKRVGVTFLRTPKKNQVAPEAHDPWLPQEMALVGKAHVLFSSDFPHGEGRDDAANELLERADLSGAQKRKILYDDAVRFYGAP